MQARTSSYLAYKAYQLRRWSLIQTTQAGSGHPTTCLSAADIVAVLFFNVMQFDPEKPDNLNNDHFILSKGHASPLLYAAWKEVGLLSEDDLMGYRSINSVLEGHPTLRFSRSEAATGSLGIGLSIGLGMALASKTDGRKNRTYVLMGDSEISEGSVWEAVQLAVHYKLDNLIGIVDLNRLGQSTETLFGHDVERYAHLFQAFGWHVLCVDGHHIKELWQAFKKAHEVVGQPVMIIARTYKGYGVSLFEDKEGFHWVALKKDQLVRALDQLAHRFPDAASYSGSVTFVPHQPESIFSANDSDTCSASTENSYKEGSSCATRKAYGSALAHVGSTCPEIVCLDAEVKNSTFAQTFEEHFPDRFFQCFIAEQNMVGMAVGMQRCKKIPFVSTFGAFFSRAYDQIRMAAIGNAALRLVGSHCGVSIGQDGPSQMALEDIGLMRMLPDSCVLYPGDAVATDALVGHMVHYNKGISYLRTTRAETPVIYNSNEEFPIGGCKVLRESLADRACIIAAGITLFQALTAYDRLAQENIFVSVIDLYSIKPLDAGTVMKVGNASGGIIISVEDHYRQGGIADALASALSESPITLVSLAVNDLPRSGKPEELLAWAGIDADAIIKAVKKQVSR